MEAKRKALNPAPPRPAFMELNLPIRLAEEQVCEKDDESQKPKEAGTEKTKSRVAYPLRLRRRRLRKQKSQTPQPITRTLNGSKPAS
jgi:hypothetical protein